jgi:hypothetical protein
MAGCCHGRLRDASKAYGTLSAALGALDRLESACLKEVPAPVDARANASTAAASAGADDVPADDAPVVARRRAVAARRAEVQCALGTELLRGGDGPGGLALLERALGHAVACGKPKVEAAVRSNLARALLAAHDGGGNHAAAAHAHMAKAAALRARPGDDAGTAAAASAPDAGAARTAVNQAALLLNEGVAPVADVQARLRQALALCRAAGDVEGQYVCLANLNNNCGGGRNEGGGCARRDKAAAPAGEGGRCETSAAAAAAAAAAASEAREHRREIRNLMAGLGRAPNHSCPICLESLDGQEDDDEDEESAKGKVETRERLTAHDGDDAASGAHVVVLSCLHMLHRNCHEKMRRDICPLCMA